MKKRVRRRLTITVLALLVIMLAIAIFKQEPVEYTYEQVTVGAGDTFWNYYEQGYYADMCYSEALYTFKQDNDRTSSKLIAGEIIVLRKGVE